MSSKFRIEDTFNITGRGVVLTGCILDGDINVGDSIQMGSRLIIIKGIEMYRKGFNTNTLQCGRNMDIAKKMGDNIGIIVGTQINQDEASIFRKKEVFIKTHIEIRDEKINQILNK